MEQKAQRVSKMKDNKTLCLPSAGYEIETTIDFNTVLYEETFLLNGSLPESDLEFPKGAPLADHIKLKGKIYKVKQKKFGTTSLFSGE